MLLCHQSVSLDVPVKGEQAISEVKSIYNGPTVWADELMEVPWG